MQDSSIASVFAREVLDSRGTPTIEVEVSLKDGSEGRAMVPSGASTGEHEVLELRDGDPKRFAGKGMLLAVRNVNETLSTLVTGKSFKNQRQLDEAMIEADGTEQKSKLGANAILGLSLAFAHAVAQSRRQPLFLHIAELLDLPESELRMPVPLMNVLNGGLHANNGLEIQEFMIVPHGFGSFSESLRSGCEIFYQLKKKLQERSLSTAVGDEGGFAPAMTSTEGAMEIIAEAIQEAGYALGKEVSLALDVAASSFYNASGKQYAIRFGGEHTLSSDSLMDFYKVLLEEFPVVSIEDGLDENDWEGWKELTQTFGKTVQLVGDDLFVTRKSFVEKGVQESVANAVLIKLNQIGTLTETLDTMKYCRKNGYRTIVSHRSGETEDVTIAHLAVGSGSGQIKTGSLSRSDRTAKYNELLRIEEWAKRSSKSIPFAKVF